MTLTVHGMSMGWHPDLPDIRDYTGETDAVQAVLSESQQLRKATRSLPKAVDLRPWCSPIEDQGQLGSCTANAGVGLYEYFERRAHGKHVDASRLFLYKVTRKLMGLTGDTGAYLRDTMKAHGPLRRAARALLALPNRPLRRRADRLPVLLRAELPGDQVLPARPSGSAAGRGAAQRPDEPRAASCHACSASPSTSPSRPPATARARSRCPAPTTRGRRPRHPRRRLRRRQEDRRPARARSSSATRGAPAGAMGGYGWLPYDYILASLADDFWTLVSGEFVDSDIFK